MVPDGSWCVSASEQIDGTLGRKSTGPAGLIFGFATLSEANLVQSVNILADAIAEL